jgi:hypothetical protein
MTPFARGRNDEGHSDDWLATVGTVGALLLVSVLVLGATQSLARPPVAPGADCAVIASAAERLTCYDNTFRAAARPAFAPVLTRRLR